MKHLMIAIAMFFATATATFAQVSYHENTFVERGLSTASWKHSVQRASVWDGSDWALGLIVRDNGTPVKYAVGTAGLTREIAYDPQAAAAWARALTGNPHIKPVGTTTVDKTYRRDGMGNVISISAKTRVRW